MMIPQIAASMLLRVMWAFGPEDRENCGLSSTSMPRPLYA